MAKFSVAMATVIDSGGYAKRSGWLAPYKYIGAYVRTSQDPNMKRFIYGAIQSPTSNSENIMISYIPTQDDMFANDWSVTTTTLPARGEPDFGDDNG